MNITLYNKGSKKITLEGEFNHDEVKSFSSELAERLLKMYPNELKELKENKPKQEKKQPKKKQEVKEEINQEEVK